MAEVRLGPYHFSVARFYPERDQLDLANEPGDLAIMGYETEAGDRWFVRDNFTDLYSGVEIEQVTARVRSGGIIVELPDGTKADMVGAEPILP